MKALRGLLDDPLSGGAYKSQSTTVRYSILVLLTLSTQKFYSLVVAKGADSPARGSVLRDQDTSSMRKEIQACMMPFSD